jgi:hypothetical protein
MNPCFNWLEGQWAEKNITKKCAVIFFAFFYLNGIIIAQFSANSTSRLLCWSTDKLGRCRRPFKGKFSREKIEPLNFS